MQINKIIILFFVLILSGVNSVIAQDNNIIHNVDDDTLNKLKEEIKKFHDGYDLKGGSQTGNSLNLNSPLSKDHEDKLYYFISFSMPDAALKQAVSDGEKYGIYFVIRGLYKNDFMETAKKVQDLIGDKKVEVLIDPILFEIYKVGECKGCSGVPTLVYTKNVDNICENCSDKVNAVKISGNVTIKYALTKIVEKDSDAKKYIK